MKKAVKVLTVIALVALVAFSFVSCGDLLGDLIGGDDSKGGGGGGGGGSSGTGSWPPGNLLSKYGLSGLSAPSGAHDMYYAETTGSSSYDSALMITFDAPSSAESAIESWFSSNWNKWHDANTPDANVRYYEKAGDLMAVFYYYKNKGEYMIMAYTGWKSGT
jgi:hypothetical protein